MASFSISRRGTGGTSGTNIPSASRTGGTSVGGSSPLQREPLFDPLQWDLFEQGIGQASDLVGGGMGDADAAIVSRGRGALTDALSGFDPAFIQSTFDAQSAPMRREFEENFMPSLRESLVAGGDFWSTGRQAKEEAARTKFQERMEAQLANLSLEGRERSLRSLPMVSSISGIEQGSTIERLNAAMPWLNLPTEIVYGEPTGSGGSGGSVVRGGSGSTTGSTTGTSTYTPPPPSLRDQLIEAGVWGAAS